MTPQELEELKKKARLAMEGAATPTTPQAAADGLVQAAATRAPTMTPEQNAMPTTDPTMNPLEMSESDAILSLANRGVVPTAGGGFGRPELMPQQLPEGAAPQIDFSNPSVPLTAPDVGAIREMESGNTATLNIDGGSATVPQSLAAQTFGAQAPMGQEATQEALQARFGAPTISAIQSAPQGLGLATDPQGRMIDPTVNRSAYDLASAKREERAATQAAGFGTAVSDADRRAARGEGLSMEQATRLTGGDRDKAAALVEKSKMGYNPLTNQSYADEEIKRQQAAADAEIKQAEEGRRVDTAGRRAEEDALDAQKTQAQIDEINARTKSKYGADSEEGAVSSAEMKNTVQLLDDANIYYDPDKGSWMKKGGIWGKSGDKELDKNSEDYKKIASTKGGALLLKDPELINPDAVSAESESMIEKVMGANPSATREEVIQSLKDAGRM